MHGFWTALPMAVVMSAGPQIVTATFLATSQDAKRNSLAFLAGVAAATTIGVTVFFLLGSRIAGKQDGGKQWLDWVIIGLLVILVIRVYVKRNETEPPKWMGRLQRADARFAATIGFLLYLLMPTDLIAMPTVGAYLARRGRAVVAQPRLRHPHAADRGTAVHRAPRHGRAGRDPAPEHSGVDERELLDRQRGRAPLLSRDGAVLGGPANVKRLGELNCVRR